MNPTFISAYKFYIFRYNLMSTIKLTIKMCTFLFCFLLDIPQLKYSSNVLICRDHV